MCIIRRTYMEYFLNFSDYYCGTSLAWAIKKGNFGPVTMAIKEGKACSLSELLPLGDLSLNSSSDCQVSQVLTDTKEFMQVQKIFDRNQSSNKPFKVSNIIKDNMKLASRSKT